MDGASGLNAIQQMFERAKAENRSAFLPYFPIGYPTYDESIAAIRTMAQEQVDGFEIGIPFSDPLADGAVIQAASQIALDNGTTVKKALTAVRELRSHGVKQPMLMFSYLNPLIAYGTEQFVYDAKAAGADGLIVPDLPPEEAHLFAAACEREQMALVFFVAPTTHPARIHLIGEKATGFIYVVSVTGITGTRTELPSDLREFIARVRSATAQPLVMGFGISKPEHVQMIQGLVDGFIVGSALVKAAKEGTEAVRMLTQSLR
jgi:tryptophan synthase alpha chain